ncbi:MAG: hypothetical protein R3343_08505 [Nitriliruptorales bacterium]|nr:hypothetical protein [Nitriliruptorales bacterium]
MQDFVSRHGVGAFPHAVDEDGSLWAMYDVSYQPAWAFVNQDGEVRVHAGPLYDEGLEEALADLTSR